jgi:hypothetical protein
LKKEDVSPVEVHAFTLSRTKQQSEGQGCWLRSNEITSWRKRLNHVLKWLFPPPASLRSRYRFAQLLLLPLANLEHLCVGAWLDIEALPTHFRDANLSK